MNIAYLDDPEWDVTNAPLNTVSEIAPIERPAEVDNQLRRDAIANDALPRIQHRLAMLARTDTKLFRALGGNRIAAKATATLTRSRMTAWAVTLDNEIGELELLLTELVNRTAHDANRGLWMRAALRTIAEVLHAAVAELDSKLSTCTSDHSDDPPARTRLVYLLSAPTNAPPTVPMRDGQRTRDDMTR